jgi:hypothetical protein
VAQENQLGTIQDSFEDILAKLTAARWYMDSVSTADADVARQNLRRAHQAYHEVSQIVRMRALGGAQHRQVQEQLEELRARLQAAGLDI